MVSVYVILVPGKTGWEYIETNVIISSMTALQIINSDDLREWPSNLTHMVEANLKVLVFKKL